MPLADLHRSLQDMAVGQRSANPLVALKYLSGRRIFFAQVKKLARWMISHVIARCLNALRIVKKEQLASLIVMISKKNQGHAMPSISYMFPGLSCTSRQA